MTDDEIIKTTEQTPAQIRMAKARDSRSRMLAAKKAAATPPAGLSRQAPRPAEPAPEPQAAARTPSRTPVRTRSDGRVEVEGHHGEVLTRTRVQVGDIFEIPPSMVPKGWSYQWNAVTIAGNSEILLDTNHMMYLNGWRPVPAERYAGTLVPKGAKGTIIRGQQMLVERPEPLTIEAKKEDEANARQLISDRNDALKLSGVKKQMTDGFEMGGKYRGTGGDVRISIDKGLDIPRPQHTLTDPE